MSDPNPGERERLGKALSEPSGCATLEELSALADALLEAPSRARVAVHVAMCARCEAELSLLKEFESAVPRPDEEAAVNWIADRLRLRFGRNPPAGGEGPAGEAEEKDRDNEPFSRRILRTRCPRSGAGSRLPGRRRTRSK